MLRRSPSAFVVRAALCLLCVGRCRRCGARCPTACSAGGGPAVDRLLPRVGQRARRVVTCTDGDPGCDVDGTIGRRLHVRPERLHERRRRRVRGHAARRAADAPARGAAPKRAHDRDRRSLPMATEGCTDGGLVKLAIATSGRGSTGEGHAPRDRGRRRQEGQGHLQARLQSRAADARHQHPADLHVRRCTFAGCHWDSSRNPISRSRTASPQPGLVGSLVASGKLLRVKPGNLRKSYVTRSLFGNAAVFMPDGCPSTRRPKAPLPHPDRDLPDPRLDPVAERCNGYSSLGRHAPAWSHFT